MPTQLSNISIAIERCGEQSFLSLVIHGTLNHEDYTEMRPMLDEVLNKFEQPTIHTLVDITDLDAWTLDPSWDNLQLMVSHEREFKKIAIIGNQHWQRMLSKVGDWFMIGDVHYFEDKALATAWLAESYFS